jgi:hypothetical protein
VIELTLKQRRLSKLLGVPWYDDYLRKKADGLTDKKIADYYRIDLGAICESTVTKWARRERNGKRAA